MRMAKFVKAENLRTGAKTLVALDSIISLTESNEGEYGYFKVRDDPDQYMCVNEWPWIPDVSNCIVEIGGSDES